MEEREREREKTMIRMSDYSYSLQNDSIARYPAHPRGSSQLMRWNNGRVTYYPHFANAFPPLAKGAHVVLNDSRVLDARLFVLDATKRRMELMILDLGSVDVTAPCNQTTLRVMLRTDAVTVGDTFHVVPEVDNTNTSVLDGDTVQVVAVQGLWEEDEESDGNGMECYIQIQTKLPLDEYLTNWGSVPIPPYFQRDAEESDRNAYNNVYAAANGSVAAPTAGLHFTSALLTQIGTTNCSYLTLHVGAGTFKPVLRENAADHDMHAETFSVSVQELERIIALLQKKKPLIVVGTTSCRTLESLYWCGVKQILAGERATIKEELELAQFEWKSLQSNAHRTISNVEALQALVHGHGHANKKQDCNNVIRGTTCLMIAPNSYEFQVVDHLITNFHAPDSTLMLLVAAFVGDGDTIKQIYEDAQARGYRFLSYGDVCLFSRPGCTLPVDE